MPRTDEIDPRVGEFLALPGLVWADDVLDLVHDQAFTGRAALMQADIRIGEELPAPMKHADLVRPVLHDAPFAVGKIGDAGDKHLCHSHCSARRPVELVGRRNAMPPGSGWRLGPGTRVSLSNNSWGDGAYPSKAGSSETSRPRRPQALSRLPSLLGLLGSDFLDLRLLPLHRLFLCCLFLCYLFHLLFHLLL